MQKEKKRGAAMFAECPKGGYISLEGSVDGKLENVVFKTSCKAWECRSCRDRLVSLFKQRVSYGVSQLGACAFITTTYAMGKNVTVVDAFSARKHLLEWSRRIKKIYPWWKNLGWFRVPELTKKGQVHVHAVMGPIPKDIRLKCYGRKMPNDFPSRIGKCLCLAHILSSVWWSVTGDSFVVDCRDVLGTGGAGAYLAKYLKKGMYVRTRLEELGFVRRWSANQKWPRSDMRLENTVWWNIVWAGTKTGNALGAREGVKVSETSPLAVRTGTASAMWYEKIVLARNKRKTAEVLLKRLKNATLPT